MTTKEKENLQNWVDNKNIQYCKRLSMVFYAMLILLDIDCYFLCRWFVRVRSMPQRDIIFMMITLYGSSIFGWIFLTRLSKLLLNLGMGEIFIDENVRYMQIMARCCLAAAVITGVSAVYYLPFLIGTFAMLLTALIIRIVADVFRQAIVMQQELDLTV